MPRVFSRQTNGKRPRFTLPEQRHPRQRERVGSKILICLFDGWAVVKVYGYGRVVDYWIYHIEFIMLASRLQNASSLLFQTQFGFATKNLKQIKIRMKAVESIKKITKVHPA